MSPASSDKALGMNRDITRRDFLGSTALGSGAALLSMAAPGCGGGRESAPGGDSQSAPELLGMDVPDWGSYGGVGDYANSYGNTEAVVRAAHSVRTGRHQTLGVDVADTGEVYDLVIVGAGFSGLAAAYEFKRHARPGQTCLPLDNHPMFGGEAKRNEFMVNGLRLMGPQGSNGTVTGVEPIAEFHDAFGIPNEFEFAGWDANRFKPMDFPRDNYGFMLWGDNSSSIGYFFDESSSWGRADSPTWARGIWWNNMEGTPFPEQVRRDLLAWRANRGRPVPAEMEGNVDLWLDSMTYQHYLENVLGHGPEVASFLTPIMASGLGLGCDAISAYRAKASGSPGFDGYTAADRYSYMPPEPPGLENMPWFSFPGGNTGIARYFVKWLIPNAIAGGTTLEEVITHPVSFDALDRPDQPVSIRLASTVVHVSHEASTPEASEYVVVGYTREGQAHRLKARSVVMAGGSWMNRNIVQGAPDELTEAWQQLNYASILSVNVALTNWRPMYELGVSACHWSGGLGFSGNIRRPMHMGSYQPPLDPDQPAVFTMYVTFPSPGLPARQQGQLSRLDLLNTPYADYERQIREQLVRLFGASGFDPARDIAGVVLNRWGHAYVVGEPGFHISSRRRQRRPTSFGGASAASASATPSCSGTSTGLEPPSKGAAQPLKPWSSFRLRSARTRCLECRTQRTRFTWTTSRQRLRMRPKRGTVQLQSAARTG